MVMAHGAFQMRLVLKIECLRIVRRKDQNILQTDGPFNSEAISCFSADP